MIITEPAKSSVWRENELKLCASVPQYFISKYCFTLNPEKQPSIIHLKLYPFQLILVDELRNSLLQQQSICINKTKQQGCSWSMKAYDLHTIMFQTGIPLYDTSRKEQLVDDGGKNSTQNSLFGKMRFMYRRLPAWMRDYAPLEFTHLLVENKRNGSMNFGESSNPNAGAGGTFLKGFWDETALTEKSESIYASFHEACRIQWLLSTPNPRNPRGGAFPRIWFDQNNNYKKIFIHWSLNPERNQAWYLNKCRDLTSDQIAATLDGRFDAIAPGLVYQGCFRNDPVNQGGNIDRNIYYDNGMPLFMDWDLGFTDATSIGFFQLHGRTAHYIADLEVNQTIPELIDVEIKKKLQEIGYRGRTEDIISYSDPQAGHTQILTGRTMANTYAQLGYMLTWIPIRDVLLGIQGVKRAFQRKLILFHPRCTASIDAIQNYRWPLDRNSNPVPGRKPVHNWTSHSCDRIRYMVENCMPEMLHDPILNDVISVSEMDTMLHAEKKQGGITAGLKQQRW